MSRSAVQALATLWLCLDATAAQAGSLRVWATVGDDGSLEPVAAAPRAVDVPPGPLAVLDARGDLLVGAAATGPLARDVRSVLTPDGGEAVRLAPGLVRVDVPWPEGAAALATATRPWRPRRFVDAGDVTPLRDSGPADRRLDLVVLAEGYRASDLDRFEDDAVRVLDHLDEVEPYATHGDLLNVWLVPLESPQPGADSAEGTDDRDTALGCWYGCGGLSRLLCCDEQLVADAIAQHAPFADGVLVLVNDRTRYGGSGAEAFAVAYTGDEGARVATHELSHTLIGLWDEYSYGIDGAADDFVSPNCHPASELPPRWEVWVDGTVDWMGWPEDPATTCRDGLGTAADIPCAWPVCSFDDWVRPTRSSCLMHTLQDRFCPVCSETIVTSLYRELGGVRLRGTTPSEGRVAAPDDGTPLTFGVEAEGPAAAPIVTWTLDGEPVGTGPTLELDACALGGTTLTATVADPTPFVRSDPEALFGGDVTWSLDLEACPRGCGKKGCATAGPATPGIVGAWLLLTGLARRRRRR